MGSQTPQAAGSNTTPLRSAEHNFGLMPGISSDAEGTKAAIDATGSTWHIGLKGQDGSPHDERHCVDIEPESCRKILSSQTGVWSSTSSSAYSRDIPEQLVELIIDMIPGSKGKELGDAFRCAADWPPITKQSLSELDIQNINTNIKLRHDINFDRDLSFRPNLDGTKGQEKIKASTKYWNALEAELELYALLFQGGTELSSSPHTNWLAIVHHAQRRIPKMFETIYEILKSLVPDRDHSRVDEHFDVSMLMQEIERGVCDLVRLAEWMAHLLKEHCAPMRDEWVDKMVKSTRDGVTTNCALNIVDGLRQLLGILEAMKLDVANHQIRNLKTILIEDTVNFERQYHLEKLVNGRSSRTRINIDVAQKWYTNALQDFRKQCTPQRDDHRFRLEVFARAVVSTLTSKPFCCDFPETFHLDHDRLRALKSESNDLVYFEICFDMFELLLKELGFRGRVSHTARHRLRASLVAIINQDIAQNLHQWVTTSEAISLELVRQALAMVGCPPNYDLEYLQNANRRLQFMFHDTYSDHASALESGILLQVLALVDRHIYSSPSDLFNHLITLPSPQPIIQIPTLMYHNDTLAPHAEQLMDLSNRITHIVLLHWRVWGPIAYIQDDGASIPPIEERLITPSLSSSSQNRPPPPVDAEAPPLMLKTSEPPDPGQETQFAHGTSLP